MLLCTKKALFLGVIHWEILPPNQTITAKYYCKQLERLQAAMVEKRPHRQRVIFLHDNARPHTAVITKNKLRDLNYEVLPHPPYAPDLAPTDFQAFLSLQNFLNDKFFETEDQLKNGIAEWINSRPSGFWVRGFTRLPERWEKTIAAKGDYFSVD